MRFYQSLPLVLLGINTALGQEETSSTVTRTLNKDLLLSQAAALTSLFPSATPWTLPFETPGGNLVRPPSSIIDDIITGVPPTAIAELLLPASRSSIRSEFAAGHTPSWYQTLPDGVKDYVSSINTQVAAGKFNVSATPVETRAVASPSGQKDEGPASGFGSHSIVQPGTCLLLTIVTAGLLIIP